MSVVVAHLSDIHFGGRADLRQLGDLEAALPALDPRAIVVSGDLCQRARHGELQAARRYCEALGRIAPTLAVPGNHDVQWWRSPFSLFGQRVKFGKYRRYFGEELTPVLETDGLLIAGMLSAHGLAWGSLTWNPNDMTVRGHLPASEVARVRACFADAPDRVRLAVLHHNVLKGRISRRWGLARPRAAQRALLTLGADAILCGHDHEEGAGQIAGQLPVSTAGTHSTRSRGGRPCAFNLLRIDADRVVIEHHVYAPEQHVFRRGDTAIFARTRSAAPAVAG